MNHAIFNHFREGDDIAPYDPSMLIGTAVTASSLRSSSTEFRLPKNSSSCSILLPFIACSPSFSHDTLRRIEASMCIQLFMQFIYFFFRLHSVIKETMNIYIFSTYTPEVYFSLQLVSDSTFVKRISSQLPLRLYTFLLNVHTIIRERNFITVSITDCGIWSQTLTIYKAQSHK